ncbi:MAG: AsmA family protein [Gallionella sp.]
MPRPLKILLLIVSGLVVLLVLVAVAVHFFVNVNAYKPQLETAASEALGVEVKIGGSLGVDLFPGFYLTLDDVHLRNRGADLASAKEVSLNIALIPLLHREVHIEKIRLKSPTIFIEKGADGNLNIGVPGKPGDIFPALNLGTVSFTDGTLRYTDKQSGSGFEAGHCHLDMRQFRLAAGKSSELLQHVSFTSQLACADVRGKDIAVSDFKVSVAAKGGVFDLKPVAMRVFGAQGSGNIRADFSGSVPHYHADYSLPQFRIEALIKTLSPDKVAEGLMNFSANLTMQGRTADEMKRTAGGTFLLRGENLTLDGRDLDRELSRYASSQNFSLVDVGAFFLAGPVGVMVTKGRDFARVLQGSGGTSTIRMFVSDWKVEHGVAQAQDAAMATNENRLAFNGKIDFVNERFIGVTMALVDAKGCAMVQQKISGTFQKPVVEQPNVLKALAGPALKIFKKARDIFPGGECEVFYAGSVAAPK